ncbi:MAG: transglycosylase SLT domain-containing protein [Pseudomonadota bacterium]
MLQLLRFDPTRLLWAALASLVWLPSQVAAAGFLEGVQLDDDIRAAITSRDPARLTRQGARLEHGEGIARNADGAVSLYCLAARMGHADAQYALGWMYANGRGVARNDALAAAWFQRSAGSRDKHSQRMLRRLGAQPQFPARCLLSNGTEMLPPLISEPRPSRARIAYWVRQLAPQAGIDPNVVLAMIQVESGFNPQARSPKNARGLMQLLPRTARRFGTMNEWDPLDNIRGGIAYMEWLLAQFGGNMRLSLAGYNAGEGAVRKYKGIPPYKETQHYVKVIYRICQKARAGKYRFFKPNSAGAKHLAKDLALLTKPGGSPPQLATCTG